MENRSNGGRIVFHIDDDQFRWALQEQEVEDSKLNWNDIPIKSIIAIIPSDTDVADEHRVLYVVDRASSNDTEKDLSITPQSLRVKGLPTSFVAKFQPAKQSPWCRVVQANTTETHIVISNGSGTGHAKQWWKHLVMPLLVENGFSDKHYTLHSTTSESSITELILETILPRANKGIPQSILLLSGDGGIVDTINALLSVEHSETFKKPSISLLPAGTGNALANSAVVGADNTMGLRTMFCGDVKELPLFRATFSLGARLLVNEGRDDRPLDSTIDSKPIAHGAVVCSWGLHATLVADSDTTEYRQYGAERFKMAGKEALFPSDGSPPHPYRGKVSVRRPDKDEWEVIPRETHGYILATLVSNLEAGFTISPSSRPLDGKLRLVHFGPLSGEEAMEVMTKAYQDGKHVEDDKVGYDEIQALRIDFDEEDERWRRVCLDGKIIKVEKGGWIEVRTDVGGVVDLISRRD